MQPHNRVIAVLSALYLMVIAFTSSSRAMALQTTPGQSGCAIFQESQMPDTQQSGQPASKALVFSGTIIKSGSDFLLKDASGKVYILDAPEKAEPFEGKSVKVTGILDADAKLLHVEVIEELTA